jgi:hypothetical protein
MLMLIVPGCVRQATPAAAEQRNTPPPWSAPRDAVSYIEAAGLELQPLSNSENSRVVELRITVDGTRVEVPAYVGIDRVRALQASVHTHDASGQVWLEGRGAGEVTLGQFFTLWGVRFDDHCLGSACEALLVKVDGVVTSASHDMRLAMTHTINMTATSYPSGAARQTSLYLPALRVNSPHAAPLAADAKCWQRTRSGQCQSTAPFGCPRADNPARI